MIHITAQPQKSTTNIATNAMFLLSNEDIRLSIFAFPSKPEQELSNTGSARWIYFFVPTSNFKWIRELLSFYLQMKQSE